jgi:dTDP-glucose pyrophosphorylase
MFSKLLNASLDLKTWTVAENDKLSKVFLLMNEFQRKDVYVLNDKGIVTGVISEGDIIRSLINQNDIYSSRACDIAIRNFCFVELATGYKTSNKDGIQSIPIIDESGRLVAVSKEPSLFCLNPIEKPSILIMAGGKGIRLGSLTRTKPKPLMKIGELTFLELVVGYAYKYGVREFLVSVNYLKDQIKDFLENLNIPGAVFKIIEEPEGKYLGTAGVLHTAASLCSNTQLIVSNGDLFINENAGSNFREAFIVDNNTKVVCVEHEQSIQFGVIQETRGKLTNIIEKPSMTYTIAAGVYSFNIKDLQNILVKDEVLDMPDLIKIFLNRKHKIDILKLKNCDWIDIGTKEQLMAARAMNEI